MERTRFVAVALEQRSQRIRRTEDVLLIRDTARRQEVHRITGQELKLARACARAEYRGVGVTMDCIRHTVDIIHWAFRKRQIAEVLKVRP